MHTVMLCGPMTGNKDEDSEVFKFYEDLVRKSGFNVMNPFKMIEFLKESEEPKKPKKSIVSQEKWVDFCCLARCLNALTLSQGIFLMPDWDSNDFSYSIFLVAQILGLDTYTYSEKNEVFIVDETEMNSQPYDGDQDEDGDIIDPDDYEEMDPSGDFEKNKPKLSSRCWRSNKEVGEWLERQMERKL